MSSHRAIFSRSVFPNPADFHPPWVTPLAQRSQNLSLVPQALRIVIDAHLMLLLKLGR